MDAAAYLDPDRYATEIHRIWRRGLLVLAHTVEIPQPGDATAIEVGDDSVLLVRGKDGEVRGFHNVCPHRGTRLLEATCSGLRSVVCPYHRWIFELDGRLRTASGMPADFDLMNHGLNPVSTFEVAGLILASLSDPPVDTNQALAAIAHELAPHRFDRARVAYTREDVIAANWKLVFENNRECYHCPGNHPEYCAGTIDVLRDQGDPQELDALIQTAFSRWRARGIPTDGVRASSQMTATWYRASRTPLRSGYLTETADGQPCAPPMGDWPDIDVGTARITIFPNFWSHANGDYAFTTRLFPLDATRTLARCTWLVRGDAPPQDVDLERMRFVWESTSLQDWALCERQQRGIRSSAYRPGPLSPTLEAGVAQFRAWVVSELARY